MQKYFLKTFIIKESKGKKVYVENNIDIMDSFIFKKKEKIQNLKTEQITGEKNEKNPTKNYSIFLKKDQLNANFLIKK